MRADTVAPGTVTKLAFGSCQSPHKAPRTSPWGFVAQHDPQVFVWSGDVTYAKANDLASLARAYEALPREYVEFANAHTVIGTWDDHDYGVNDGGAFVPHREARRDMFLDFLKVPRDSPRRQRRGVYASHDFGAGDTSVRVIALDTRFDRSDHVVPSVGHWFEGSALSKLSALTAAAVRLASAWTGLVLYRDAERHVLSAEQWAWLDDALASSRASVNILVSSVQVLTTNPSLESFGHFPAERARLLGVLRKHRPRGLVIVSGDVHDADLLGVGDWPLEATSSGLTHSCSDSVPQFICNLAWSGPAANRRYGNAYLGRNYGVIDIDWTNRTLSVNMFDIPDAVDQKSTSRLGFTRSLDVPFDALLPAGDPPGITLSPWATAAVWGLVALCAVLLVAIVRVVWRSKAARRPHVL